MIVDRYQVQQWLTSHASTLHCPICGGRSFNVEENSLAVTNCLHEKAGLATVGLAEYYGKRGKPDHIAILQQGKRAHVTDKRRKIQPGHQGKVVTLSLSLLVGLLILMFRRVVSANVRVTTSVTDVVLLTVLLAQVVTGILTAIFYRWGSA